LLVTSVAMLMSALAGGCSSDHTIILGDYQPRTSLQAAGHPKIVFVDLADKRSPDEAAGSRIGELRGLFGNISASVLSKDNPVAWVNNALCAELKAAGFDVERRSAAPKDSALVVRGEVTKILIGEKGVSFAGSYSTTIHVHLVIDKGGRTVYNDENTGTVMTSRGKANDATIKGELERSLQELLDTLLLHIQDVASGQG
jgi:hypothetical protein